MAWINRVAIFVALLLLVAATSAEIHRAKTKPKLSSQNRHTNSAHESTTPEGHSRETWIMTVISALLVGLSGIFPLLVIPLETGKALKKGGECCVAALYSQDWHWSINTHVYISNNTAFVFKAS